MRKKTSPNQIAFAFVTLGSVVLGQVVLGQEDAIEIIAIEPARVIRSHPAENQQEKFWNDELMLQIQELDSVCNLTESQKKKLRIARKGAVSRAVEKWKEMQGNTSGRILILNANDPLSQILVHKEPIWVKAMEKVLTAKQKEALKKHRDQQRLLRRKLAVDEYVVNMDYLLKLNSKQRNLIAKLVDETHGDKLDKNDIADADIIATQVVQLTGLPDEKLQQILTAEQMTKYSQSPGNWVQFLVLPKVDLPNRPILGIHLMSDDRGVVVRGVIPGSPADLAGMLVGDVVQTIDQQKVTTIQEVIDAIQKKDAGQEVVLSNLREDHTLEVTAKLMFHNEIHRHD